ncbi:histidine kinase [Methyloceanibacter superfactus]|uniref:Histidine kinase n=2 Tax=Methyloceanibacter superfactus TaxID=1774969 RepID=A0A1E3VXQ9_9HYPH|nr:histidine kinase [Methyloceanibacter superfactus]
MTVANVLKIKGRIYKTVRPDETVQEFAKHLKDERIGAMIVTHDGYTLDGIISERDIAYGLSKFGDKLPNMKVSELMTKVVIVCTTEDSIDDVMNLMTQRRIRHLPVKDSDELVGIISMGDVVKAHLTGRLMAAHMGR